MEKVIPHSVELRARLVQIVKEDFYLDSNTSPTEKLLLPEKHKLLLDNINGFIAVCNYTTGTYEYVSEGIKSHLGYDIKGYTSEALTDFVFSIILKDHANFVINRVLPDVLTFFKEHATAFNIKDYRFTCCAKVRNVYGAYQWYLFDTVVIAADENGLPLRTLITCTNIDQFKKDDKLYFNILKKNSLGIYEVMMEGPDENNKRDEHKLTSREVEIVNLIGQGNTNKEIASKLFISLNTVQTHRKNIMKKTECSGTAELVNFAFSRGLL